MRPLVYLTVRTTVNGFLRALTSARRLIGIIVFTLYYVFFFIRPFQRSSMSEFSEDIPKFDLPPFAVIDSVVFWLFAGLSFLTMIGMGQRNTFRPADVDVLFATPINPRVVLAFRILRDYAVTLLAPLLLAIFTYRPAAVGFDALFNNFPQYGQHTLRLSMIAWILMALAWVSINTAISLRINRSDIQSDLARKRLAWSIGAFGLIVAVLLVVKGRSVTDIEAFTEFSQFWLFRVFFFTATAATAFVMGPIQGSWIEFAAGGAALLGVIAIALRLAMSQSTWMYDQAASGGPATNQARELHRQGDLVGMFAEQARQGKPRAVKQGWYHRLNLRGPTALVWKDLIIQFRSTGRMSLLMAPMVLAIALLPLLLEGRRGELGMTAFLFVMNAVGVFMIAMMQAQSGYIELLRRVDLQKPLPFNAATISLWEVVGKAVPAAALSMMNAAVLVILRPEQFWTGLAIAVSMPALAVVICAALFLVTLLFPDVDDPTQRGFRGLMNLLALLVLALPGIAVFALVFALLQNALAAAIPWAIVNIAVAAIVATIAGGLYATFNPSE